MRYLFLLAVAGLAACAANQRPYAPVENVRYSALGQNPFWMVTIGDDRIVLTMSPDPGACASQLNSYSWPRTLPRTQDGVQRWESSSGTSAITVEAMEGPCEASRAQFRDRVRVRLNDRQLEGCGGPRVGPASG